MDGPYTKSAAFYDALYAEILDYESGAGYLRDALVGAGVSEGRVLEVASGTGRYLEELARWYDVTGVELSAEMIEIARVRLPEVEHHQGDMRTFDLGDQFDAVVCMFSSIAYMTSVADLDAAIANFASHTRAGGCVVVEPWIAPDEWDVGRVDLNPFRGERFVGARAVNSVRHGDKVTMQWAYAVAHADGTAAAFIEEHATGLYDVDTYAQAFAAAGLVVEHDSTGPIGRGLYVAKKNGGKGLA